MFSSKCVFCTVFYPFLVADIKICVLCSAIFAYGVKVFILSLL